MTKRNKIIYWIATIWLSLGMLSSGIVQLIKMEDEVKNMAELGYAPHVMTILGIWKVFGVITILIPKYPLLKEWAYAGFFFAMSGAIFAHVSNGDTLAEIAPPLLLLILTVTSWYFRPTDRMIVSVN